MQQLLMTPLWTHNDTGYVQMPCHADVSPDLLKVKQEIFLIYNRDNNSDDFPFYHN